MNGVKLGALGLAALVGVVGVIAWAKPASAGVPATLQPSDREHLEMTLTATGVQIYECRAQSRATPDAPAGHTWAFVAPEADLFDAKGKRIGHHGAGPFWQAGDGSRVVGKVKARVDAPVTGTIPWLLLTTEADGPHGVFSKVTSIQRIDTAGGAAPATICASRTNGTLARIDYTAVYRFFSNK